MKHVLGLSCFLCFLATTSHSQVVNQQRIDKLEAVLKTDKTESQVRDIINGIIKNPGLYNFLWSRFISRHDPKYAWLKDINLTFKTFQVQEDGPTSLGFSYDINYDRAKFKESGAVRKAYAFGLAASGNVAFKKETNPNNFLETNLNYSFTKYVGGVMELQDSVFFQRKDSIEQELTKLKDPLSKEAQALWKAFGEGLEFTNQYYYNILPQIGYETNQDFSASQFTPTVLFSLGAKSWNDRNTLSKLNVFDYPFALLRLLFGTDKRFTPYGSTIPTAQFGFTYVTPSNDSLRKQVVESNKSYPRLKFETGFRTIVTRIEKENIFFNANFRFYKELNAPLAIKNSNLDAHTYFVMALQSTSGFFVSYSTGRLPLDAENDKVYSLGFNYKF
tara:strand:+ start:2905 stop:4071 length:1167 start_codon:yes stop_codon:yes gene_type:complete